MIAIKETVPSTGAVEPMPFIEDERMLVGRAKNGDKDAMSSLYNKYAAPIFRYSLSRVNNIETAQDIASETFVRVVANISQFTYRDDIPFGAWVYRIAHNQVVSHFRRSQKSCNSIEEEAVQLTETNSNSNPEKVLEQKYLFEEIRKFKRNLSTTQRKVFDLRFSAGLSVKETAAALGKTENNVKVAQHKAISRLKLQMKSLL